MPFDWKNAELEDRKRDRQVVLITGVTWTAVGIIGTLLSLVIGHPKNLSDQLIWTAVGLVIVVIGLAPRRRTAARPNR